MEKYKALFEKVFLYFHKPLSRKLVMALVVAGLTFLVGYVALPAAVAPYVAPAIAWVAAFVAGWLKKELPEVVVEDPAA
jgi:hypothetical protein